MRRWLGYFKWTGYVSEGGIPQPTTELEVYRGAAPKMARRMSWTTSREKADGFAQSQPHGALFQATIPPSAALAMLDHREGRNQDEVIVNPHRLMGPASPKMLVTS
jgi:hypothetical protein